MKRLMLAMLIVGSIFVDAQAKEVIFECTFDHHVYSKEFDDRWRKTLVWKDQTATFNYDTEKNTLKDTHGETQEQCSIDSMVLKCTGGEYYPKKSSLTINRVSLKFSRLYFPATDMKFIYDGTCQVKRPAF